MPGSEVPTANTAPNRPQQAGSAAARVNPASMVESGLTPPATAPASRAGAGSVGNARPPFKGLR